MHSLSGLRMRVSSVLAHHLVANALVFCSYQLLSLLMFGTTSSITRRVFGAGDDPLSFVWLLEWWPWAILHGRNPFVTDLMWYPYGLNLTWVTSVPTVSLLGFPITVLMNAVATFNMASLLAPALSAWTAYLLAKRVTNDRLAAWICGYLFGFSSYELGHLLGHLNLDTIFVVPLLVLFSIRRLHDELTRRQYVTLMTASLLAQFGLSTEVFATACFAGAAAWAVFLLFAENNIWRRRMVFLAAEIVAAVTLTAVIASPYLLYIFKGVRAFPAGMAREYSADLLNYAIPTGITRFGYWIFAEVANRFTGNWAEQGAYLGLPLILILAAYSWRRLSHRAFQGLLIVLAFLIICSLGPTLWIGGIDTHVPLPWRAIERLPLIRSALPGRFTMYVSLVVGIVTALWVAAASSQWLRVWRVSAAAVASLCIFPNTGLYVWRDVPLLPFFEPNHFGSVLGPNRNILILPYGRGLAMLWQWQTKFAFTQSGGYIALPDAVGAWPVIGDLWGEPGPTFGNDLLMYCAASNISAILIAPDTPAKLRDALEGLGWPVKHDGEITVISVPEARTIGYYRIEGDYSRGDPGQWMGRSIVIKTHGRPIRLTLDGTRPDNATTDLRIESRADTKTVRLGQNQIERVVLPADDVVTVTATPAFIPDEVLHNGDRRALTVHIALSPVSD